MGGCSGKNGTGSGSGSGSAPTVGACDDVRSHVAALYQGEPVGAKVSKETAAELVEANTHMVITDCERSPEEFLPCIRSATTVAVLEKDCTISLDDEGSVEGGQFR